MIERKEVKLKLFCRGNGKWGKEQINMVDRTNAIHLMVVEIIGTFLAQ